MDNTVFDKVISEVSHNLNLGSLGPDSHVLVLEDTDGGRMRVNDPEILLTGLKAHLDLRSGDGPDDGPDPLRHPKCLRISLSPNAMKMISFCIEQARDSHVEEVQNVLGISEEEIDRIDEELREFGFTI